MNVLMIGLDETLSMESEMAPSDSQDRHILYGGHVSGLFIVVLAGRKKNLMVKQLSDKVIVYPVCYRDPVSYLSDAYSTAKRICQKHQIELITTQDPLLTGLIGYLLKRKYGVPIQIQLQGDYLDNKYWLRENIINYPLNWLGKWLVNKADGIRVVSSGIKKHLVNYGISEDKIHIVPTPVNLSKFSKFSAAGVHRIKKKYLLDGGKAILFVGRLSREKNLPDLLRAAKILLNSYPDTRFLICGNGKERKYLEELSLKLGIKGNVIFLGNIPHDQLPDYYHACDIFVLPSDYEGLGRVLVEAAMAVKPIVATRITGSLDIVVDGKTGSLVSPRDHEQLAQRLIELIEHPDLAMAMGRSAKKFVMENFDFRQSVQKVVEEWDKVVLMSKQGDVR